MSKLIAGAMMMLGSTAIMGGNYNLLKNSRFDFMSFDNHRSGARNNYSAGSAAFWNTGEWGDISAVRESHAPQNVRPRESVGNLIMIKPGKKLYQFFTLPEAHLAHGDTISLNVSGFQKDKKALKAVIKMMKLDSEDGTWSPVNFGMRDKRAFPRHSRGELVTAKEFVSTTDKTGRIDLTIDGAKIAGKFNQQNKSDSKSINTIAIQVEFENVSTAPTWIWSPVLTKGPKATTTKLPELRKMRPLYRGLPRTIQKLMKGEPLHIIVMGSSIDRGSANPPMYPYNEDPASPNFKKPLSDAYDKFDTKFVGRPELKDHFAQSRHYFSYAGRLKRELMRKFNYPANKILLNFMACDGSCIGESHSGLKQYCELSLPPDPNTNGHRVGKSWQELYPELFKRTEGTRPDLIIYGSGANEKTDTPHEIAVFEGAIRYIQRHYPNTEFVFCQFQNYGGYTPNPGDLMAVALRYQIPFIDYGMVGDAVTRFCNRYALVPRDGHPQAACHYLWFKQLEKAFEIWTPIESGIAQKQLPERIHRNTYGWEGDMRHYDKRNKRFYRGNAFILDDTAFNCFGNAKKIRPAVYADGKLIGNGRRSFPKYNLRNSMFTHGNLSFGNRHIIELKGKNAEFTFVDAKVCPNRRYLGVESPAWNKQKLKIQPFKSLFGYPYGNKIIELPAGKNVSIDVVGTDLSVVYVDSKSGGKLKIKVDGQDKQTVATDKPFTFLDGTKQYLENRVAVGNLHYGLHRLELNALDKPVRVMGVFSYDSRPNREFERVEQGFANAGEEIIFSQAFKTRPMVITHGGLQAKTGDISAEKVKFSGSGQGSYQIIGE